MNKGPTATCSTQFDIQCSKVDDSSEEGKSMSPVSSPDAPTNKENSERVNHPASRGHGSLKALPQSAVCPHSSCRTPERTPANCLDLDSSNTGRTYSFPQPPDHPLQGKF
ncbi:hypothetical protein ACOMHN_024033 [Nucella lapillus]